MAEGFTLVLFSQNFFYMSIKILLARLISKHSGCKQRKAELHYWLLETQTINHNKSHNAFYQKRHNVYLFLMLFSQKTFISYKYKNSV